MPSAINMSEKLIAIGKIVAPHGVRGDVRVVPLTDFPERFKALKTVLLDNNVQMTVTNVKYHKQFVLLKFSGLNDMDSVEYLRGVNIWVQRKDLVQLPEGHYYQFDIIGLKVYNLADEYLGVVTDILQTGSNDVYVVEQENKQVHLIPTLKKVVRTIDIQNNKMIVDLMEEWE